MAMHPGTESNLREQKRPNGDGTQRGRIAPILSGAAASIFVRNNAPSVSLEKLTFAPLLHEAPRGGVITTPTMPGVPQNIRVNDPNEDIMFGNDTTQSEPSVAVNGLNVVVGFNDSTPVASFSGFSNSSDLGQDFSDDGGLTPSDNSGDPVIAVDRAGTFYYSALVANFITHESYVGVAKSTSGGAMFSSSVDATGTSGIGKSDFQDKPWLIVDKSGGPTDGYLYLAWTRFINVDWSSGNAPNSEIRFARSTDGATTWSASIAISPQGPGLGPQGAMPAVGPNGEVYVVWLGRDTNTIAIRRSDDNGVTFNNPVAGGGAIATITQLPDTVNGGIRADSFPSIAVDQNTGTVHVAYPAISSGGTTADVYYTKSTDQGQHWTAPVKVNDDGTATDQWMVSLDIAANGVVGVMFYDRRNDPTSNLNIDVYVAPSIDGGNTFLPNKRITTTSFPPAVGFDPMIAFGYMGDYNQMAANGTRFHLAWGDNRDMVGTRNDPNVYYAVLGTEDCYVRDNPSDDGTVPDPGLLYISPDIQPAMNPSVFGTPNPVTVQVNNMGPLDAKNVTVKLFWADPATNIPASAWNSNRITIGGPATNQQVIASVPAGASATTPTPFVWNPPNPAWATQVGHFCLLAQIDSPGDPVTFPGGGWDAVKRDNNLAVRNVHVQNVGGGGFPTPIRFFIVGDLEEHWIADLVFDARPLTVGVTTTLTVPRAVLKNTTPIGMHLLPSRPHRDNHDHNGRGRHEDRNHDRDDDPAREYGHKNAEQYLQELHNGRTLELQTGRLTKLSGIELAPGSRYLAELNVRVQKGAKPPAETFFNVMQVVGRDTVGGLLYLLRFKL
jgi:hypothetical protein